MPVSSNHIAAIVALALAGFALGGCASINEKLSAGMGDYIPQWAGGLPADAPPRRGTPQYDEYMKERERKRLEPAVARRQRLRPRHRLPRRPRPNASARPAPVHSRRILEQPVVTDHAFLRERLRFDTSRLTIATNALNP